MLLKWILIQQRLAQSTESSKLETLIFMCSNGSPGRFGPELDQGLDKNSKALQNDLPRNMRFPQII